VVAVFWAGWLRVETGSHAAAFWSAAPATTPLLPGRSAGSETFNIRAAVVTVQNQPHQHLIGFNHRISD